MFQRFASMVVRFLFSFLHLLTSMNSLCSHTTLMLLHVRESNGLGIRSLGLRVLRNTLDLICNVRVRSEGLQVKFSSTFFDPQGFPKIVILLKDNSLGAHSKCLYYPSLMQIHCPHPHSQPPLREPLTPSEARSENLRKGVHAQKLQKVKAIYHGPVVKQKFLHISFQPKADNTSFSCSKFCNGFSLTMKRHSNVLLNQACIYSGIHKVSTYELLQPTHMNSTDQALFLPGAPRTGHTVT